MKCSKCGSWTRVYATRRRNEGTAILRRRICKSSDCQERFTTLEQVALVGRLRRGRGSARRCAWALPGRDRTASPCEDEASS